MSELIKFIHDEIINSRCILNRKLRKLAIKREGISQKGKGKKVKVLSSITELKPVTK